MSNNKFKADLKRVIEKGNARTSLFVKKILMEIDQRVVLKSPVDTGRFRANWMVGNYSIDSATSESTDSTGMATIGRHRLEINSIKVEGQTIYVTNSLPYAARLEYEGWSKQAPAGMVRVTLAELSGIGAKAVTEVKYS